VNQENIPLAAHFLILADAYDAMTTEKPFRRRLTREEALQEIERGSGTQFDPDCVAALRTALEPQISVLSPRLVRTDAPAAEFSIETTPQAASA